MGLKDRKGQRWIEWAQAAFRAFQRRLTQASHQLSVFRWAFMPVGLCALVAVGVHAAADVLDDQVLSLFDTMDKGLDWVFSRSELTQAWVNAIGSKERVFASRTVMFVWEVAADIVLAFPALGYEETGKLKPRTQRMIPLDSRKFPALVERVRERPTVMRIARPLATAAISLAGAYALARMLQARLFLSLRGLTGIGFSSSVARLAAIACLLLLVGSFGWRVFLRSVQHADEAADAHADEGLAALKVGMTGTLITLPLAVAALLGAVPVWSLFR